MNDEKGASEELTVRQAARRAKREATRTSSRSSTLRRKGVTEQPEQGADTPEPTTTKKPAAKKRVVRKKKTTAKTTTRKPAAKKIPAAKMKKRTTGGDEEFELRALPDGTNLRIKKEALSKAKRGPARRSKVAGDTGPGPAIIYPADLPRPERERGDRPYYPDLFIKETKKPLAWIRKRMKVAPTVGVILGSGMGDVAARLVGESASFSYDVVPGFIPPAVPGHGGALFSGMVAGRQTLVSAGRLHYYETGSMEETLFPLKTFLALGVRHLIITTSAGALNPNYREGDLMLIEDHLNMMGANPLLGGDPTAEPSIFLNTQNLYDLSCADRLEKVARRARINLRRGVLAAVSGPFYETWAERAALRALGGDAVCMSTVPEAIIAAYAGVRVTALALIANDATVSATAALSHAEVSNAGKRHAAGVEAALAAIIEES